MTEKKTISICAKKSSDENTSAVMLLIDPVKTTGKDGQQQTKAKAIVNIQFDDPQEADRFVIGKKYSLTITQEP